MEKIKQYWEKLPDLAKIAIIIVVVILIMRALNYAKSYTQAITGAQSQVAVIDAYEDLGETPSFSDVQYKNMADRLDTAMRGAGTNYDEIFNVMGQLNNNLDAVKLNQAFGIREYTSFFVTMRDPLIKWLQDDMDAENLNNLWSMLELRGITYRFV